MINVDDTQINPGTSTATGPVGTSSASPAFGEPLSNLLEPSFKLATWFLSREDELPDPGLRDPKELARHLDADLGTGPHDSDEVRAAPGFRDSGLSERRLIAYTSAEAHYSIPKNAGIAGLGRHNVRLIAADEQGRMVPATLEAAIRADLASGFKPFFINATAGTTVRGAFDPIRPLAALARKHGLWLHVDGALGGTMVLSTEYRYLVDGSELAASFAWNPHKMMGVPLQTSVILVARKGSLAASLDETADYLFQADVDEWNPGHRSVQCGRRNDAFKLWAAWYELGDAGWDARIGRQMQLAALAADMIAADPELELLEQPQSICVYFAVKGCSSEAVCDRLDHDGALKIGHGQVRNRRGLRLVCVNPELDQASLQTIFDIIKQAGHSLLKEKQQ